MKSNAKKDSAVAVEKYTPNLSSEYMKKYKRFVSRLGQSLPINRNQIIDDEIEQLGISGISECEDVDKLKYMACLSVLRDLSQQGWCFEAIDDQLKLRMDDDNLDDKAHIRYRLSTERDAQFKVDSIKNFILKMETPRDFNGESVSIRDLIGDIII